MVQLTKTGFQTLVNNQPAPGVAGDFYGANPRAVVLAGPSSLVAPPGGLIVGNFAWADLTSEVVSQSYNPNGQLGFLRRSDQAIITDYLGFSTFVLNAGFPVTLFSQGDFWGFFAAGATPGQKVYADPSNGALVAGGASAPAVASVTASMGASFTGVIASNVLTVSALTGTLHQGDLVSGTGVAAVPLGAQLTGTPGGTGTYTLVHADVSSEAMTTTSTVLDVTAVASGTLAPGDALTGPVGGGQIVAQLTGTTGGVGSYSTTASSQTLASGTVTVNAIATPWKVKSTAAAGKVAKISTWGK